MLSVSSSGLRVKGLGNPSPSAQAHGMDPFSSPHLGVSQGNLDPKDSGKPKGLWDLFLHVSLCTSCYSSLAYISAIQFVDGFLVNILVYMYIYTHTP